MERVTVVIPNYNGIKYLAGCLDSLRDLEEQSLFRVLVIDNGSADGSVQLLKDRYPWAELICLPENTGFCHAVNLGIQRAQTPYVLLLNNDTVVLKGFVKALYQAMERDEKIFSVSARMLQWDHHDRIDSAGDCYCAFGWAFSRGKGRPADRYDVPARVFSACGGAALYRRAVFAQIGYFDEAHFAYLEDVDIGYRARIYGYENWYEPGARVLHAGSAASGSRYNPFKTRLASANSVYLIGKNMPLWQILLNSPFLLAGFTIKTCFFLGKKMGTLYLEGLYQGWKRLSTEQGRGAKVRHEWKHWRNYLAIQGQLYRNLFRLLDKK